LNDAETEAATTALGEVFGRFKPHTVRWWAPEQRDLNELPGATKDDRLVVGRIKDLTGGSAALLPDRFSFEPEPAVRCYHDYQDAYAEFAAQATFHNAPRPERLASLEECESRGALYCLRDRDRFAGLMAARPHALRGIRGWEVVEEILGAEYRGKGLAVAMQRLFVSRLDPARGLLVMGEIADGNLPSLRTAQRVGRKDVGGWYTIRYL
jgi:RimJ/RimL family protein N-acetyltransferase